GLMNPPSSRGDSPTPMSPAAFRSRLSAGLIKGTRLLEVGYDSESPAEASKVANRLMAIYIEEVRNRRSAAAQSVSTWLSEQLQQTKNKLEQATNTLQNYEGEHKLLFFGSRDGSEQNMDGERLRQLQAELTRVQTVRIEKESLYHQTL